jgi:hypothetical protein
MQGDVDGDIAHAHLDPRPVVKVESTKENIVAQTLAILVVDEEARGRREHLARLLVWRRFQQVALDANISQAPRRRPSDAAHLNHLRVVFVLLVRRQ